jgi:hypothetical protein
MDAYRAFVYVHLICGVVLTGLALYWFIMRTALRQRFSAGETQDLLQIANRARWPHVAIPYALRLPLPWVAWAILGLLVASGLSILHLRGAAPVGALWWLKMALVAAVVGIQLLTTPRPRPKLIGLNLALVLAAVLVSGWMIR